MVRLRPTDRPRPARVRVYQPPGPSHSSQPIHGVGSRGTGGRDRPGRSLSDHRALTRARLPSSGPQTRCLLSPVDR